MAIDTINTTAQPAPVQEPVGTLNLWFYKGHGNYDFEYWGSLGEGTYTVHAAKSEAPSHNSTCNETLRAQGKAYPRTCKKCGFGPCVGKPKSGTTPPAAQRQWVGLMQGVRVEREYVVVSVHGGNRAARELCAALIQEMNGGHSAA